MAAQDEDCDCELPLNMSDENLSSHCRQQSATVIDDSPPTTGFIAFARLCRIAGKIQQLNSPRRLRELASASPEKVRSFVSRVVAHDKALRCWLESLPDEIRFSANTPERNLEGSPHLTMCVIIFIIHAGSLLNIYRLVFLRLVFLAFLILADAFSATPNTRLY